MATTLTLHRGGSDDWESGEKLLNDVLDLAGRRLPGLAPDDPERIAFMRFMPGLARDLGRPAAEAVERLPGGAA